MEPDLDMLTCLETEIVFALRQGKRVGACVRGDVVPGFEGDGDPAVFLEGDVGRLGDVSLFASGGGGGGGEVVGGFCGESAEDAFVELGPGVAVMDSY